jgi:hypothetical protein
MVIEEQSMLLRKSGVFVAATFLFIGTFGQAVFAADEMTIEDYIDEARPYLHHSCQSAWEASNEDPDEYVAMMNRFVAIAFINHNFDVQRIDDAPEADQEQLRVLFYNDVGKRCKEHPDRLLAGIVERSIEYALKEMDKKGN